MTKTMHGKVKSWVVFHVDENGRPSYELRFTSPIPACALMIRLEMEDFRLGRGSV
jgi:hypothetical protein